MTEPQTNTSLLGHDMTDALPHVPALTGDDTADVLQLYQWALKMKSAFTDLLSTMNTRANIGFLSATVGSDSILSSGDGVLTITDSGGSTVTISGSAINIASFADLGEMPGDLDDIDDGGDYKRVAAANIDGGNLVILDQCSGNVDFNSQIDGAEKPDDNATVGSDWAVDLSNIPTRFADSIPASGAGLIVTADAMGYYRAGKKILEEWTAGTFVVGELAVQAVTNAKGVVTEVNQAGTDYLIVDVLTGSFGAGNVITGQTSGATVTPSDAGDITAYTTMGMLIASSGDFYFGGDDDNYVAWDGTKINIVCGGGFIGSSTDYFNISEGKLHTEKSGDATTYLEIHEEKLYIVDSNTSIVITPENGMKMLATGGDWPAIILKCCCDDNPIARDPGITFIKTHNDSEVATETVDGEILGRLAFYGHDSDDDQLWAAQIICEQEGASAATVPGKLTFRVRDDNSNQTEIYIEPDGDFNLDGNNIINAIIGSNANAVQGALRVDGDNLECYLNGAWRTAASG